MKNRKKFIALVLAAVLATLVGVFVSQGTVSASRGPNVVQTAGVNAELPQHDDLTDRVQLVATNCKALKYPDGAYMLEFCYEYLNNLANPSTWIAGWRNMTNIAYPSGHSDYMRYCHFAGSTCSSFAAEGQVKSDGDNYTISDANTFWVEFEVKYGEVWYCRRAFGNHVGDIAFSTCP